MKKKLFKQCSPLLLFTALIIPAFPVLGQNLTSIESASHEKESPAEIDLTNFKTDNKYYYDDMEWGFSLEQVKEIWEGPELTSGKSLDNTMNGYYFSTAVLEEQTARVLFNFFENSLTTVSFEFGSNIASDFDGDLAESEKRILDTFVASYGECSREFNLESDAFGRRTRYSQWFDADTPEEADTSLTVAGSYTSDGRVYNLTISTGTIEPYRNFQNGAST